MVLMYINGLAHNFVHKKCGEMLGAQPGQLAGKAAAFFSRGILLR